MSKLAVTTTLLLTKSCDAIITPDFIIETLMKVPDGL